MLRIQALLGSLSLALFVALMVVAPAMADTAPDAVNVTPLWMYQIVEPFLSAIATASAPLLVAWGLSIYSRRTGNAVSDSARAELQQTAQNAAGRIVAAAEGPISNISFPVNHPAILAEVPKVINKAQDAINVLGITPADVGGRVADLIQAKIGLEQMKAVPPATAPIVAIPLNPNGPTA